MHLEQFYLGCLAHASYLLVSGEEAVVVDAQLSSRPVLIANNAEELEEARTRLARVGLDLERGFLEDGVQGWASAGL